MHGRRLGRYANNMPAHHRRRRRDSSGHVDPYFQRRRRYESTLRPLGLWDAFERIPRPYQEMLWKRKAPDPVLSFGKTLPDARADRGLRAALENSFRRALIHIDGAPVAVRDFFSIVAGLKMTMLHTRDVSKLPEAVVAFLREARPRVERWFDEHLTNAFVSLVHALDFTTTPHTRLDTRLLATTLSSPDTANGKFFVRATVSAVEPQTRRVSIDGAVRPVYRVAQTWGGLGVQWLAWDGRRLDHPDAHADFPLYVQSHALRHLQQRVNLPQAAPYLHGWLAESLREPNIIERQGADLLVEYRLKGRRMGYLVVTPVEGILVVRTFKFLTMEQTPEARMLEQRLRLTRRDVDWLSLNELASFTQTDLRQDPILRPLLEACGCGHLFALDDDDYAPEPKAYAAEVRRYLRIAA